MNRRHPPSRAQVHFKKNKFSLAEVIESLESRSMLSAATLNVAKVLWNGSAIDAVRDEYVLRMPQLNVATAKSIVDYSCATPAIKAGWSLQTIGSGFFKLQAPGASQASVLAWATKSKVKSIDVNSVSRASAAPNDPLFGDAGNWAFTQIDAASAWDSGTGTVSTVVALLDTGVDYTHPDLAANMWRNPNEIAGDGIDNDRNGYIDDIFGINAITRSSNPMDDNGHGTMCAGLLGAVGNNATGIAGANWTVKIMAIKISDSTGTTSLAAKLTGIQYVFSQKLAGQKIAAANLSYSSSGYSQSEFDALNQLGQSGVTLVAAAGNNGTNNDTSANYPASYAIPSMISVAATDLSDALATFPVRGKSNYGASTVDLGAPGLNVLSTRSSLASTLLYPPLPSNAQYSLGSGTSFATALVAGTAALLKSIRPLASTQQIKSAILNSVDLVPDLSGKVLTGGRLNMKGSVDAILSTIGTLPVASIAASSLSFLEGNVGYAYADIKVSLDRPCDPGKSASVWYTTLPGGSAVSGVDFIAQSGFVNFSRTQTEQTFRIKIVGDRVVEANETFTVQLDPLKTKGATIGTSLATITILDDDNNPTPVAPSPVNPLLPRLSIAQKTDSLNAIIPVQEGRKAVFVVSLDRASNKVVTVKYRTTQPTLMPLNTATAGLDYVAVSGTLTFKPGQRTKKFVVKIMADRVNDANETFHVVLYQPINAIVSGGAGGVGGAVAVDPIITDVVALPVPGSGFQITVTFPDSSLTTAQQAVFQQAAARWQQIITGDLLDVTDPSTGQIIDDLWIVATAPAIDGLNGILGQAGPTDFRAGPRGLPWKGEMEFDSADVVAMESDGTFNKVIQHEMGHVLGFGTLWAGFNLVSGLGTANPTYTGANALREYKSIFATPATSVPVENVGGVGSAGSHWRESVFDTELMTSLAENTGTAMPISRITVGQFADLGYAVNYAAADAYTKPTLQATPSPSPPSNGRQRTLFVAPSNLKLNQSSPLSAVTIPTTNQSDAARMAKIASVHGVRKATTKRKASTKIDPQAMSNKLSVNSNQPTAMRSSIFAALGQL